MPTHIENLITITLIPLFLVLLGAACLIWAEILGSMLKPRGARPALGWTPTRSWPTIRPGDE